MIRANEAVSCSEFFRPKLMFQIESETIRHPTRSEGAENGFPSRLQGVGPGWRRQSVSHVCNVRFRRIRTRREAAVVGLSLIVALLLPVSANAQQQPLDKLEAYQAVGNAYRIEVITVKPVFPVKLKEGPIDGKPADARDLERYADLFAMEFNLYPPDLIKRTKLKRVIIGIELKFAGQLRTAIPDWDNNTLYLDPVRGANNKSYVRKVIHHEFFHMVDFRDDGQVYKDERWIKLNSPHFKYGSGGKNAQDLATTSLLTDKFPGFVNHYSTTGVEEDKAEIFANMIVEPIYFEERIKNDPVLKAKTARMRELLKEFCPAMDDKFWNRARTAKRID